MDQVGLTLHAKALKVSEQNANNPFAPFNRTCNSLLVCYDAETEAWFIDSLEEWRKAKNLSNFILLGHSFGGYVAAKYALKVIAFKC